MARGLTLPDALVGLLNELDFSWPDVDEVRTMQISMGWIAKQTRLDPLIDKAQQAAERVWTENKDDAVSAFKASWEKQGHSLETLRADAAGVALVGAVILVCAIAVLMLEIWVIAQLVLLAIAIAQAVATAAVTFGASLLQIPVIKQVVGRIINMLIDRTMGVLLG